MIVESSQILCSVFYYNSDILPPYKLTHENHPCCIWARGSLNNFKWLLKHTRYLLDEYSLRYKKHHKCNEVLNWINDNITSLKFDNLELTDFVQAMPEHYRKSDPVQAYRDYYKYEKSKIACWKNGIKPYWFV